MAAPSFRLKIALLSTLLSGAVLLASGVLFLSIIRREGLSRIDREILALGEAQLKARPDRRAGLDLERSLRFLYGPEGPRHFILRLRTLDGATIFASPGWPAAIDEARLPTPVARFPPPPRGRPPGSGPPPRRRDGERPEGPPRRPDDRLPFDLVPEEPLDPQGGLAPGGLPPRPPVLRVAIATLREGDVAWRVGLLVDQRHSVLLGQDLAAFRAENARYRNAFLLGAPLALLLLAGAGAWVAERALRPIRLVTDTAQRITARGLGERVPAVKADREIARLIAVINGMLDRLERSFTQAARFSADAAHELKTPLTILQGHLEQGLQEAADGSPAQRTLSDLLGEVQRLRSIVGKLLLLARADAGALRGSHARVDWTAGVDQAVADTRELAPELAVTAEVAPGVTVLGDPDLLSQALRNLASNAIKFCQGAAGAPGAIRIELRAEPAPSGGRALLRVANTGPPIPDAERERLFERFYRGDPAHSRRVDGVGLGLSLAREIALAHRGSLSVANEPPGWVSFTLVLPLAEAG